MRFTFGINGNIRKFWYNNVPHINGAEGTMEELIDGHPSTEDNPAVYLECHRDENSDLFFITSDGFKVMCKDAITMTPEELIRLAYEDPDKSGIIFMDEMMKTMQKYGAGCVRFRMNNNPLDYIGWKVDDRGRGVQTFQTKGCFYNNHTLDYKPEWVEYEARAEYNRMPEDNYKLRLYAVENPDEHRTYDFYTSDMNTMWIARPDYMQLTLGTVGDATGIYGKMSDFEYLRAKRKEKESVAQGNESKQSLIHINDSWIVL